MTAIEREIYDRLKHIIDDIYRKRGIASSDIRKHFLKPVNFKKVIHLMRDLKHIYDEQKYPIAFENTVYDILFFRILMDRIYHEKDNPEEDLDESLLQNYENFIKSINESTAKKLPKKMIDEEETNELKMDTIKTRTLETLIAKYNQKAKNSDAKTSENYKELAKKYQDEIDSREKKLHDDFMKHVDSEGRWIRKPE